MFCRLEALLLMLGAIMITGTCQAGGVPTDESYFPGRAFFKVTPEYKVELPTEGQITHFGIDHIDKFFQEIDIRHVEATFPSCVIPPLPGKTDLTRIYTVYFDESLPVEQVCADLSKLLGVEYAEPWYIYREFLNPNDPYRNQQYGLDLCEANDAYDICTGDRTVPVAIVDSGVDMDHADLAGNLWVNPGEDLNNNGRIDDNERNNRDDDRNGKVDDFYGWDFVGNDNNPDDTFGHGTHCAGIASAVTNNRTGVASVGFSCGIMAVRTGDRGRITHGYQGIQYAARNGAKVISCSWGGYQHSDAMQDVIDYAYEHDAMVLAAAGNDGITTVGYPAGYDHVVAVASTGRSDRKSGFSNYGDWIDICAPGERIISTFPGNRYAYMDGTSMACPFAASVAILIRAAYQFMDVDEATQLLLDGADNIDAVNRNYRGQLGSGRINAFNSLRLGLRPMLTVEGLEIIRDGNDNGRIDPGESIQVAVRLSNNEHAVETESIEVTLSSDDPTLDIRTGTVEFDNLQPGDEFLNEDEPFEMDVSDDAIPHTTWFTVQVEAEPGGIDFEEVIEVVVGHPDILVVDDDDGDSIEEYYLSDIEDMNRGWVRWDVSRDFAPDADLLTDYGMVVWFTGNADPPLDELDLWQLEAAYYEGADIMLIGHRIGDQQPNRQMLRDIFGADHEADSVQALSVEGLPGDRPLDERKRLYLFDDEAADYGDQSPSSMSPVNGADSLMVYQVSGEPNGVAAVYRYNERRGSRTAYFGFAFEGTNGPRTSRSDILDALFDWFTSDDQIAPEPDPDVPGTFSLDQAYPNPFNNAVRLGYTLPARGWYKLAILDLTGRELDVLETGVAAGGRYRAIWNATGNPSGVYFVRLSADGSAPIERKLLLIK